MTATVQQELVAHGSKKQRLKKQQKGQVTIHFFTSCTQKQKKGRRRKHARNFDYSL